MSSQRYERVAALDNDDEDHGLAHSPVAIPSSPPPSFRSHPPSRRHSRDTTRQSSEEERDLDDAFDAPSDADDDDDDTRDRRRLMGNSATSPIATEAPRPDAPARTQTTIPTFANAMPAGGSGRIVGSSQANDGVFANMSAKPKVGEDLEEKPPTYEEASADATPPYWETHVLSPYNITGNPDDVFVDGLLVGSFFSFVWNGLISMSFQVIGFLLTYLLHTTHAAKHGSRAGLGITLVQYGFQMRYAASNLADTAPDAPGSVPGDGSVPDDPNAHNFDPSDVGKDGGADGGMSGTDWLSYVLMIVGWFILIRSVSDFLRARRHEQLVLQSSNRGLNVPVVAEGENPSQSV